MGKTLLFDETAFAAVISKAYVAGFTDREAMQRIKDTTPGETIDMAELDRELPPEAVAKRVQEVGGQIIRELRARKQRKQILTPYEADGVVTPWRK